MNTRFIFFFPNQIFEITYFYRKIVFNESHLRFTKTITGYLRRIENELLNGSRIYALG